MKHGADLRVCDKQISKSASARSEHGHLPVIARENPCSFLSAGCWEGGKEGRSEGALTLLRSCFCLLLQL